MPKTAIVVLNYDAWEETVTCVDSIFRYEIKNDGIVIVDNASKNDSILRLKEKYGNNSGVYIIQARRNEGFARGNNLGIMYARNKLNADFVLLLNSDVVIQYREYLDEMLKAYTSGVGVVGSKIVLKHGRTQGGEFENLSFQGILWEYIRLVCHYYYIFFPFKREWGTEKTKTLRLHGCSILLTPDYFEKFDLLWPYTFLYGEEMILSIMLEKVGLELSISDAVIYHKGAQSTGRFFGERSRKRTKLLMQCFWQQLLVKSFPVCVIKRIIQKEAENEM